MTIDEKTFTDRIHAELTASTNEIDAETQHRLHAIRRQALQKKPQKAWFKNMAWAPVAGVAFCSVMAIMFILPAQHTSSPATVAGEYTAMFEVVESPDDLDTITDPEFYLWLDETEPNPNKLNSMNGATAHTA